MFCGVTDGLGSTSGGAGSNSLCATIPLRAAGFHLVPIAGSSECEWLILSKRGALGPLARQAGRLLTDSAGRRRDLEFK